MVCGDEEEDGMQMEEAALGKAQAMATQNLEITGRRGF